MSTRFGVHHPSNYYWNPPNVIEFCEDLKRHGVDWYTLWANDLHQVELCSALTDHGIEIIYRPGENKIPCQFIGGIYEEYRKRGAKYCQFFNEPNLFAEWKDGYKPISPEEFARLWAPRCEALKSIGFIPVVPPLSPGGNLWHPDFFRRMMNWWKEQGLLPDLLRGCVLGIHNRPTKNHPDDPGVCSFEGYRFFRQTMMDIMQFTLPMVAPEAGYQPEDVGWDWEKWEDWNLELIRRFRPGHPKYVGDDFLAHCFWIYSDSGSLWDACGLVQNWYYGHDHGGDTTTNLWRALEAEDWDVVPGPEPPSPPPPPPPPPPPSKVDYVGLSEEMIAALTITPAPDLSKPYWKVTRVEVQPETDNLNAFAVLPTSYTSRVMFYWPGAPSPYTPSPKADPYAPEGAREWAASMPMFASWGSYGVQVFGEDGENSEDIFGFGLFEPEHPDYTGHHPTLITFELVEPEEPEPPPPPPPQEPYKFLAALNKRLKAAGLAYVVDMRTEIEDAYVDVALMERSYKRSLGPDGLWTIFFHHTAVTTPLNVMAMADYHINTKGWPNIAPHFCVDTAGGVWFTKKLAYHGPQCGQTIGNLHGVSIEVNGDFTEEKPTEAQLDALWCLVTSLEEFVGGGWGAFHPLPIIRHKDVTATACPGSLYEDYRRFIEA